MTRIVARPLPKDREIGIRTFEESLSHRAVALLDKEGATAYRVPGTAEWLYRDTDIECARTRLEFAPMLAPEPETVADCLVVLVAPNTVGDYAIRVADTSRNDEIDYDSVVNALDRENFLFENVDKDEEVYTRFQYRNADGTITTEWVIEYRERKEWHHVPEPLQTTVRQYRSNGLDCDEFFWRKVNRTVRKFGPVVVYDTDERDPGHSGSDLYFRCLGTNNSGCYRGGSFGGWIESLINAGELNPGWDVVLSYSKLRREFGSMIASHADRCQGRKRSS